MLNIVKLFYTYACILIRIKTICVHKPHEDLRPILLKQITNVCKHLLACSVDEKDLKNEHLAMESGSKL